jgi:hypothetical protein
MLQQLVLANCSTLPEQLHMDIWQQDPEENVLRLVAQVHLYGLLALDQGLELQNGILLAEPFHQSVFPQTY